MHLHHARPDTQVFGPFAYHHTASEGGAMTYNPSKRPRHPVKVAELNDANALRGLVKALDDNLDTLTTAGCRSGAMHARAILIGTIKAVTP